MSTVNKHWLIGLILAAMGIILARVISPRFQAEPVAQMIIFIIGVILAFSGMIVIMLGMRKYRKNQ